MATTLAGLLREGSSQGAPYTCYRFLAPTRSTEIAYLIEGEMVDVEVPVFAALIVVVGKRYLEGVYPWL